MQPRLGLKTAQGLGARESADSAELKRVDVLEPSQYRRFRAVSRLVRALLGRRLVRRSYYLGYAYYWLLYLSRTLVGTSPLIIYQMGKVGSSTLWRSLEPFDLGRPAFRVHALSANRLDRMLSGVSLSPRQYYEQRSEHNLVGRYLAREWNRARGHDRWKVITLVRDPLAQSVSTFFQLLDLRNPGYLDEYSSGALGIERLVELFLDQYKPYRIREGWFDAEMRKVFGLDVFEVPFDCEAGYSIYHADDADVLLIRLEDLDRCGKTAMQEFLGVCDFAVLRNNVGAEKEYSEVYREFRARAALPERFVREIYDSDYAKHFYSPKEREAFAAKWGIKPPQRSA